MIAADGAKQTEGEGIKKDWIPFKGKAILSVQGSKDRTPGLFHSLLYEVGEKAEDLVLIPLKGRTE